MIAPITVVVGAAFTVWDFVLELAAKLESPA